ncbi:hypothetical protein CGSSpSV36_2187 [Streptococcus pneumoniae SV36]|nr:hypothetical protein CGSSpSV36_2187 [Streptococcus pneumoniae SV36]
MLTPMCLHLSMLTCLPMYLRLLMLTCLLKPKHWYLLKPKHWLMRKLRRSLMPIQTLRCLLRLTR